MTTTTLMGSTDVKEVAPKVLRKSYKDLSEAELVEAIAANSHIVDSHFDVNYMRNLNSELTRLLKLYFRPVFVGFEEAPVRASEDRPLIYACNHSGMAFPWDAIMFGSGLYKMHGYDMRKLFRALAAPMLSASNLMNPFLLTDLWKRVGAVDATSLNFETMMQQEDTNLLIYPEGVPGIGKGFNHKYELQTFSTSMIRMALKYRTDIVGVSCINGEYINPYSYSWKPLDKFVQKLGIPFFPLAFHTLALLIQPWTFYYAWPAKLTYVRGKRYKPYEMTDMTWEEMTQDEIRRLRDVIQADMQAEIDKNVETYGSKPFNWKELWQNIRTYWRELPYWTPIGWPALFTEYDRLYQQHDHRPEGVTKGYFRFWRIVLRNPIVLAYYIPVLGWIPLLIRGYRGRRKVASWTGSQA